MKNKVVAIVTVVAVILALVLGYFVGQREVEEPIVAVESAPPVTTLVEKTMNDTSELYVAEYCYTVNGVIEEPWTVFGKELPFGGDELVYLISGTYKVGVNPSEATIKEKDGKITITYPGWIEENVLDEDSVEFAEVSKATLDQKKLLEWYQSSRKQIRKKAKKLVKDRGLYERAQVNLQVMMQNEVNAILAASDSDEEYEVEIVVKTK